MVDRIYSEAIMDYYKNPVNFGELKHADVEGHGGNVSCGDKINLFVKVTDGVIEDISFTGQGCAISRAGACVLTEMVKGKKAEEALNLDGNEIFKNLGGVIQTRIRCAMLGLNVLKKSLEEWKKTPNKKVVVQEINI